MLLHPLRFTTSMRFQQGLRTMLKNEQRHQPYEKLRPRLLQYMPPCHPLFSPTRNIRWGQYAVEPAAFQQISLHHQNQAEIWLQAMQPS
jgi:hypothetical protein